MKQQKIVCWETAVITVGELILSGSMVGIFAAFGYFQMNVLWGALAGCLVMILNYFFMAVTVSLAADRATQGETTSAKKMLQLSSAVRLAVMGVVLFSAIKLGANVPALLLPLLFTRPFLMLVAFFRKKGEE